MNFSKIKKSPKFRSIIKPLIIESHLAKLKISAIIQKIKFKKLILDRVKSNEPCYINYGCGPCCYEHMINLDGWKSNCTNFVFDLRQKLSCPSDVIDGIYSEHFLEHVDYIYAIQILRELYRVLQPGGCLRLVLPDLRKFAQAYLNDDIDFFKTCHQFKPSVFPEVQIDSSCEGFNSIFYNHSHKFIWDLQSIRSILIDIGFNMVIECAWREGSNAALLIDSDIPDRRLQSFYLEAIK